jgi:mannose-6-phosphate isomerase-like protein (cupin superfamily)
MLFAITPGMKINGSFTTIEALEKLKEADTGFAAVFRHGSLEAGVYKPGAIDKQTLHERDELYVVISGKGDFYCDGVLVPFEAGSFLFVPAGAEHRFMNYTEDFSTWVFFYGPKGGEEGTGKQIDINTKEQADRDILKGTA